MLLSVVASGCCRARFCIDARIALAVRGITAGAIASHDNNVSVETETWLCFPLAAQA
jgi:orotate phosphoribosyltransferase-like protein